MAEALLGIVIENLQSFVQDELSNYWGFDQKTEKLCSNLTAIHAVLKDAERKQITSYSVKDWMQKLTDAAYVLEGILDECSIHSKKLQTDGSLARLRPKNILFRRNIGKRMKDITQRFDKIHEERLKFELRAGVTEKQRQDDDDDDEWRPTSSVITEPVIFGRDQDIKQIVEFLVGHASNSEDLSISVYALVGMGGLGKTTLAKQVFNNDRVSKLFDSTIWVYVSNDFNTKKILQSIIEYITGQHPNLNTLEAMRKKFQEVLQTKRYLLVLDDVWNEDQQKWKELKGVLQCAKGTILVTTRHEQVASTMEPDHVHRLIELSDDDSWSLFKLHAFGHNIEEREELAAIGKFIVRKCVGSPLAIKTLGSLLRDESEVQQWQNIKESEIWDIKEESSHTSQENSILRALKLSYVNLDLSLRRCFSFCAIFPRGAQIDKEELIHLWMANGYIKSERNLEVEDVGNKVWKKSFSRSFFQEAKVGESGIITSFKIHDLFHDLAQSVVREECVVYKPWTHLSSRVHHLHLLEFDDSVNKASLKRVESLRTFLRASSRSFADDSGFIPPNSCLRALRTSSSELSPLMNLAHLRYLYLYRSAVTCLPDSICMLQKLQILKIKKCFNLISLPKHLTQLPDLRHLVIKKCSSIIAMPPNIGKLRHLRTLSYFIVGSKTGYGLKELNDLKLGGKLRINSLQNVPSEGDAKLANLINKRELNNLFLSWHDSPSSEGSNVNVERVLEALEPPSTLKSFGMRGYGGMQLPSWLRNPSVLKDLVKLTLEGCHNCEELAPLGKLAHLKSLFIYRMKDLRYIDSESYDGVEEKAFPSLEKFTAKELPKLERMLRDEGVEMFPLLSKLSIAGNPNLKLPRIPSVEHLELERWGVSESTFIREGVVVNMPFLKVLSVMSFHEVKVLPDQLSRLSALQELTIEFFDELECFPEHVLQGLTSLRSLGLHFCKKLKWLSEGVEHLACLEYLEVRACPELVALPSNMNKLTSLRHVRIGFTLLPEGLQRIPSLQRLDITLLEFTSLPNWLGDMTSLRELQIWECKELRSLPSSIQRLTNLSKLSIVDCPKLANRCKRETGEDWQYIAHIPELCVKEEL